MICASGTANLTDNLLPASQSHDARVPKLNACLEFAEQAGPAEWSTIR